MWPTSCWRFTGRCAGDRSPCCCCLPRCSAWDMSPNFSVPELSRRYEQPRETGTLRVLSYNVEGFFGKGFARQTRKSDEADRPLHRRYRSRYLLPAGVRVQSGQYAGQPRVGARGVEVPGAFSRQHGRPSARERTGPVQQVPRDSEGGHPLSGLDQFLDVGRRDRSPRYGAGLQ